MIELIKEFPIPFTIASASTIIVFFSIFGVEGTNAIVGYKSRGRGWQLVFIVFGVFFIGGVIIQQIIEGLLRKNKRGKKK